MDIQSCLKASLLALSLLSMATWLPHMYSCIKSFLLVSLPSAASAVAAPKCLFVFSNIIVVFLVSESRLSHGGGESPSTGEGVAATGDMPHQRQEEEEVQVQEEAAMDGLAPVMTGESNQEQEGNVVAVEEEEDTLLVLQEGVDVGQGEEAMEEAGGVGLTLEEEAGGEGEVEEDMEGLPPADELNRRVEDFIARFNMERQLEARMLVCCC